MAGRAHRAKGVFQFPGYHRVGGGQCGACGVQGGVPGVDVEVGVGVNLRVGGATGLNLFTQAVGQAAQGRNVHAPMGQFQVGNRRGRGPVLFKRVKHAGGQKPVIDSVKPLGAFGVARAHFVFAARGMRKVTGFVHKQGARAQGALDSRHGRQRP